MGDETDTYENRALFMAMLYGAPHEEFRAAFPEWADAWGKQKDALDRALWLAAFCRGALAMKTNPSQA